MPFAPAFFLALAVPSASRKRSSHSVSNSSSVLAMASPRTTAEPRTIEDVRQDDCGRSPGKLPEQAGFDGELHKIVGPNVRACKVARCNRRRPIDSHSRPRGSALVSNGRPGAVQRFAEQVDGHSSPKTERLRGTEQRKQFDA